MNNMEIYNKVRAVPKEAQKPIGAGRLKGMTDINPMWRIKMLTEVFGMCGIGWLPRIVDKRVEEGAGGEKIAVVDITLQVCVDGKWSGEIYGTGGSMLVAKEKAGTANERLYSSDEAFKMAYTDAISVCCKMLGFGADVYWDKDRTKYDTTEPPKPPTYEEALDTVLDFGEHKGKTLRELFKTDFAYVQGLLADDTASADIKARINIINQEIKKSRK